MKKFSLVVGVLVGFLSVTGFADTGKWLDYGNGIINLNKVNRISTEIDLLGGSSIEFDAFSLTIYQIDYEKYHELTDEDEKKKEKDALIRKAKEEATDTMDKIRDFLDDDDVYLKL